MRRQARAPTIVALDVGSSAQALSLVDPLEGLAGMFKVGLELFVSEGPGIVRAIVDRGERVFLDLKLHDIPNTVSRAAVEAGRLGVSMLTLHASGGSTMIGMARESLEQEFGDERPLVLAVTVLTSLGEPDLADTGIPGSPDEQALRLATLAARSGADGCVCSPREVVSIRRRLGEGFRIVVPGVRMQGQSSDDQVRVAQPREAIADGADWVVVGRYVNRSPDPRRALLDVIESLQPASDS